MKQSVRILDLLGDQVEVLQARIAQLDAWKKNAEEVFGRFQGVADTLKGEPEESLKDPVEALLAMIGRLKESAAAVAMLKDANDSLAKVAAELRGQVMTPEQANLIIPPIS